MVFGAKNLRAGKNCACHSMCKLATVIERNLQRLPDKCVGPGGWVNMKRILLAQLANYFFGGNCH